MSTTRFVAGDILKFKSEGQTRFRRVLTADGSGDFRTYGLSSGAKTPDGKSTKKYFVTMTAYELAKLGYELA